jgi:hypothetical protein
MRISFSFQGEDNNHSKPGDKPSYGPHSCGFYLFMAGEVKVFPAKFGN